MGSPLPSPEPMRHESRGPSALPFILSPTGSGNPATLAKAMARLETENMMRRAALEHLLLHAGPIAAHADAGEFSVEVASRFGKATVMPDESFEGRPKPTLDEVQDELAWFDPVPAQRLAADLAAWDLARAVSAWGPPGNAYGRDRNP